MSRRDVKFPDNGFEAWGGYMNAKISKLEEQFLSQARKEGNILSNIFNGVSIYVNGFTTPSAEELKELMTKHGGIYHTYQRSNDYIIASNLPDTKVKKMSLVRVVKPEWITESIAANKLLKYKDYLLYKNLGSQKLLPFNKILNKYNNECSTNNLNKENINQEKLENETLNSPNQMIDSIKNNQITKTAADPNFISEFYNNSRLHHISQLGACFKQHINNLRENSEFVFPELIKLKNRIDILTGNSSSQLHYESGKVIMGWTIRNGTLCKKDLEKFR